MNQGKKGRRRGRGKNQHFTHYATIKWREKNLCNISKQINCHDSEIAVVIINYKHKQVMRKDYNKDITLSRRKRRPKCGLQVIHDLQFTNNKGSLKKKKYSLKKKKIVRRYYALLHQAVTKGSESVQ
jgi:hypothetical protein